MNILTIDYTLPNASLKFVESLHNTGFAVIKNHPISIDMINNVYRDWEAFFASEEKNNYFFDKENQDGFFPMEISEVAKGFEIKDIKEYFHYFPWGQKPDSIGPDTAKMYDEMSELAAKLLVWIERETPSAIRQNLSMPLSEMSIDSPRTLLRILHYPPLTGSEEAGAVRAAQHEDINLITLLPAATDSGLQVKDKQGNWHDVPCDFGSVIVNIGDMLQECTNGFYPSTPHRVVNPQGDATKRSRLSLPLFLHPRQEVRLSKRYTAEEYWKERLKEMGVM